MFKGIGRAFTYKIDTIYSIYIMRFPAVILELGLSTKSILSTNLLA
jgi:hypothetical protein